MADFIHKEDQLMKNKQLSEITHKGLWPIDKENNISIECYVTNDERRFLSLRGTARTLGLKGAGSTAVSRNLKSKWMQPYLSEKLKQWLSDVGTGNIEKIGGKNSNITPLEGDLFVDICKAYVNAQRDGLFTDAKNNVSPQWEKQDLIANKLYIIMSAFAKIGIVALIDEITGYQEDRDRNALNILLAKYLSEEKLQWAKIFPDEFYKQIYRLKNWTYPTGTKRTPLVGKLTNQIVYEKLPTGVLYKLKEKNPIKAKTKRRQWKHHQFLSEDLGQPDLRDHLLQVVAIMKASANWGIFKRLFARAFPVGPQQQEIPGFEDE